MTITFSRVALTTLAVTATTLSLSTAANAQSSLLDETLDARQCVDADNVWVYVEYGEDSEKEPEGGCATDLTNGLTALKSAGFDVVTSDSSLGKMINSINGVAPDWEETGTYWSYFIGDVDEDYNVEYSFSNYGAEGTIPEPGSVEAWVVGDGSPLEATTLPETPAATGSSEDGGWIAVIAGLLALIGGGVAALYQGLITIPGLVLPKF
ncbi:hypothetical protein J433_13187 [Corynebacterium glutamicum MT]|uniref:Uncharacterized protein n=1 Tax=Corynebacterium glutamicum TaxID=1718 RepID=A0AB36IDA0_CORGT|nr:hypothetical protein [Corynebacterium glutamicum]AGN18228.1 hypothetical protein C624_03205 [Corynebacterium glutamicum SCgG1]AGN21251.1 hypothetical protein C629_03205 [Corynebacterium glutamicum SCgG2]EGV41513.1 hypothetical protein CgS9114_01853 [Corynebacterium glutamicum S9114]EOA63654.1 hypothetical protein J433_13187 [Corynebacterium glutamicum MT]EPP41639.1 hypothetical protein A583_02711 [Corynebacterium glutamicum Z188]